MASPQPGDGALVVLGSQAHVTPSHTRAHVAPGDDALVVLGSQAHVTPSHTRAHVAPGDGALVVPGDGALVVPCRPCRPPQSSPAPESDLTGVIPHDCTQPRGPKQARAADKINY